MIDVVITLGKGSNHKDEELRYCLRSIEANLKGLRDVYIVTSVLPNWMKNIKHIKYPDIYKRNKDANIIAKLLMACNEKGLSDEFVSISDDQAILKEVTEDIMYPAYVTKHSKKTDTSKLSDKWKKRLYETTNMFIGKDKEVYNFDSHVPMKMDKNKMPEVMKEYKWYFDGMGYTVRSLYFNSIDNKKVIPAKPITCYFSDVTPVTNIDTVLKKADDKMYLSYNDKGYEAAMIVLKKYFPEPSKYEKTKEELQVAPIYDQVLINRTVEEMKQSAAEMYLKFYAELINRNRIIELTLKRLNVKNISEFAKEKRMITEIQSVIEDKFTLADFKKYTSEKLSNNT
jgi:hypothetical protein